MTKSNITKPQQLLSKWQMHLQLRLMLHRGQVSGRRPIISFLVTLHTPQNRQPLQSLPQINISSPQILNNITENWRLSTFSSKIRKIGPNWWTSNKAARAKSPSNSKCCSGLRTSFGIAFRIFQIYRQLVPAAKIFTRKSKKSRRLLKKGGPRWRI